jgi:CHAT domain-containing protein
MSSLVVTDWKETPLTVKDLVAKKLHQNPPFLAHLSACSTAKNQVEVLQDEGIHLMAACQLAGFQHVIGSLWAVSADSHCTCVDVATDVYKGILQAGMSDESVARSLHSAIIRLRGGGPKNPADDLKNPEDEPKPCQRTAVWLELEGLTLTTSTLFPERERASIPSEASTTIPILADCDIK